MEPTLAEVFGSGATQDATTLTILKSDLTGLTASSSNTAESLLVGILKVASVGLSEAKRDGDTTVTPNIVANPDQSVAVIIEDGFNGATRTINNVFTYFERKTISVQLDKPYQSSIDPDDY